VPSSSSGDVVVDVSAQPGGPPAGTAHWPIVPLAATSNSAADHGTLAEAATGPRTRNARTTKRSV